MNALTFILNGWCEIWFDANCWYKSLSWWNGTFLRLIAVSPAIAGFMQHDREIEMLALSYVLVLLVNDSVWSRYFE